MSAPFRIRRPGVATLAAGGGPQKPFDFYLDRLMKMIPAECVGLYLVGSGIIPAGKFAGLTSWALLCLIGVVVLRIYGTADRPAALKPDWVHVAISAIAFVIWVYTLGGPFVALPGVYVPFVGSLLVLAWTFFVPIFYKGP